MLPEELATMKFFTKKTYRFGVKTASQLAAGAAPSLLKMVWQWPESRSNTFPPL